jgi:adenine-specific DNA-methyltransferase
MIKFCMLRPSTPDGRRAGRSALKTADQLTADKLRGGFYSPPGLVKACLDRVAALTHGRDALWVLEPSAGDGAFVRGLSGHELASRVEHVTAVELNADEARKCRTALATATFPGTVIAKSVLNGARPLLDRYDVAVGNPPFVRFQFLTVEDRQGAAEVALDSGVALGGVSNLWIPVFLSALTRLVPGGAFAFIIPAECFTGISARSVRTWLTRYVNDLQVDLFPPGSFPTVLQEVVVLSGQVVGSQPSNATPILKVVEHTESGPVSWVHQLDESTATWTRYLLTPAQLSALHAIASLPEFHLFSGVARLTVSTVTGANEYFSVDDRTLARFGLEAWALPLLARARHATGVIFNDQDHQALSRADCARWLLNFGPDLPDPESRALCLQYLREGERQRLHLRYKCRIRVPWYRVPVVRPGRLLLSKRCHRYPRLVLNEASIVTTDTIYQGRMTPAFANQDRDLVAGFHNTVTLLTAEIEGRSFGGGVLELVPTEIGRLIVPMIPGFGVSLPDLDAHVRAVGADSESLIEQTDAIIARAVPALTTDALANVRAARMSLLQRRMDRTG